MAAPPELAELRARLARLEAEAEALPNGPRELLMDIRQAEHELQGEAWSRLISALAGDAATSARMRELAGDEFIYAVLRRHGLLKPSLDERIEEALRPVRPLLHAHGGDVDVVEIRLPDTVIVRMTGACEGCPASAVTLTAGVVRAIRAACPEIRDVRDISAEGPARDEDIVSPFAGE